MLVQVRFVFIPVSAYCHHWLNKAFRNFRFTLESAPEAYIKNQHEGLQTHKVPCVGITALKLHPEY